MRARTRILRVASLSVLGVLVLSCQVARVPAATAEGPAIDESMRALLEAPDFSSPALSHDGHWIAYVRRSTAIAENGYRYVLVLRPLDGSGSERIIARSGLEKSPFAGAFLRWSPVRAELAYRLPGTKTEIFDVETNRDRELSLPTEAERLFPGGISSALEWSPDGTQVIFAANGAETTSQAAPPSDGNVGVELSEYWDPVRAPRIASQLRSFPQESASLWLLNLRTNRLARLTEADLDVVSYAWSPDGQSIVVAANEGSVTSSPLDADLYVVTIGSTKPTVRKLVAQRGFDGSPAWSPDGRWIAFSSQIPFTTEQRRHNARFNSTLAIVAADGTTPPRDLLASSRSESYVPIAVHDIGWSPDSKSVYFSGGAELRSAKYSVSLDGGTPGFVTPREGVASFSSCDFGPRNEGQRIACVRQEATVPPALVLSDDNGRRWRVIDDGGVEGAAFSDLSSEIVSWRSADDRWDVHGLLIKPPNFDPRRRYPLIVFVEGGPSMVRAHFGVTSQYPLLVWANRGFLVLAPNTRGRAGYGPAFDAAIAEEHSERIVPHGDIVSGVDFLVARGLADPDRVGITGFSYGFALAAETIAQSNRFRAAALGDGAIENLTIAFTQAALPWHREVMRDQNGLGSVFDPEILERVLRESTLFRLDRVKTPVLAEFGAIHTLASTQGRMLLHALRAHGVPVELIAYPRTGHGIFEPLLRLDSMRRNVEWFDYWLLGKATARMRDRYGSPAELRRAPGT